MADEDDIDVLDPADAADIDGQEDQTALQDAADAVDTDDGENDAGDPPKKMSDIEEMAAELGWSPQDQWRGDPDGWKDAQTFLRSTVDAQKALRRTVEGQDKDLRDMRDTLSRMEKMNKLSAQRAYDRAVEDLKAKRREAIEDGDPDTVDVLDEQIASLDKPDEEPEKKADDKPVADDAVFKEFQASNPWYGGTSAKDIWLTAEADRIAPSVRAAHPDLPVDQFYAKVAEVVRENNPDKFGNGARRQPGRVNGSGAMRSGNGSGKKTFADLPPEARAVCDENIKEGLFKDRQEYVDEYFEAEE